MQNLTRGPRTAVRFLPALALAALAACGGGETASTTTTTDTGMGAGATTSAAGATTGDSGMMAPGTAAGTGASLADASTTAQLDSVATAARTGLTSLAPSVAVPLIQSLEDKLDNSNDPALTDIAKDLEKLREELGAGTVDGGDVSEILERLGPKVTNVAANAGAASGTLRTIGEQLSAAAKTLKQ